MSFGYALKVGPLPWLFAISASAAAVTIATAEPSRLPVICGSLGPAALAGIGPLLVQLWSPAATAFAWLLMVGAMMPPLLAQPVGHVWISSFDTRRSRGLLLFGLGYALIWLAAGAVLIPAAVMLRVFASETVASVAALALAVAWSSSPAAQRVRNRAHRMRRIGAFGFAADRDCFLQGLTSGLPCAAACWPWMLVPLVAGALHVASMAVVTYLLFMERVAPSRFPAWQLPPSFLMTAALIRRQKVLGSL